MRAKCKSCGASILWATTSGGAAMPLDLRVVQSGNVRLHQGPHGPIAEIVAVDIHATEPRFQTHFASCPSASLHRKRKGNGNPDQGSLL